MAQPSGDAAEIGRRPGGFEGRPAFVTGAASGIGRATALRLAGLGAPVALVDRDGAGVAAVAGQIAAAQGQAIAIAADVAREADMGAAVEQTVAAFGSLRLAVNVAGFSGSAAAAGEMTPAGWDEMIAINLSGCFYGLHYQIPAMLGAGGGAIVNITSIYADRGQKRRPAYAAAKHGLRGLTRSIVNDYGARGIRCNEVQPGVIRTPMIAGDIARAEELSAQIPQQRLGTADEVAAAIVFLLSDEASYINGARLAVDGGLLC